MSDMAEELAKRMAAKPDVLILELDCAMMRLSQSFALTNHPLSVTSSAGSAGCDCDNVAGGGFVGVAVMANVNVTAGTKVGRWTVIEEAEPYTVPATGERRQRLRCRCDCGTVSIIRLAHLRSGGSASCGCLSREITAKTKRTHGLRHSPEYGVWNGIVQRCLNVNQDAHGRYGGRGIVMCDRWRQSFAAFYEDMGPRPSPLHSIERIDNDGNYEPGSCCWATPQQQACNRRSNHLLAFRGESLCIADWARKLGILAGTIKSRLRSGWSIERALTSKVRGT